MNLKLITTRATLFLFYVPQDVFFKLRTVGRKKRRKKCTLLFLMTHCSSKSIHVLNKSTIITNINVKGALSFVKVIQNCNH